MIFDLFLDGFLKGANCTGWHIRDFLVGSVKSGVKKGSKSVFWMSILVNFGRFSCFLRVFQGPKS